VFVSFGDYVRERCCRSEIYGNNGRSGTLAASDGNSVRKRRFFRFRTQCVSQKFTLGMHAIFCRSGRSAASPLFVSCGYVACAFPRLSPRERFFITNNLKSTIALRLIATAATRSYERQRADTREQTECRRLGNGNAAVRSRGGVA